MQIHRDTVGTPYVPQGNSAGVLVGQEEGPPLSFPVWRRGIDAGGGHSSSCNVLHASFSLYAMLMWALQEGTCDTTP